MKVSIIIPVYNRPVLLEQALLSVEAQTFKDYEVIVVDDGSDQPLLPEDSELELDFKHLKITHCGRAGAARNIGVAASTGQYVAFLDSDDLWAADKLTIQLKHLEDSGCQWSHTREQWLRGDTIVSQRKQKHKRQGDIFEDALVKCIIGPSTTIMTRHLFDETQGFDENLEVAEDYEYWLRILDKYPVAYVDQALTTKRAGEWDQLSEKYGQIEIFRLLALADLLYKSAFGKHNTRMAEQSFLFKCDVFANGSLKRGRTEIARRIGDLTYKIKDSGLLPELLLEAREMFLHIVKELEDNL